MKRLDYIDNVRGVAILGIMILHIFPINAITIWIDSFVVSLFFILSGYIYESEKKKRSIMYIIKRKFMTLMIPYYLFCCFHIIFRIIMQHGIDAEVKGYILSTLNLFGVEALCYLPALYIAEIIFAGINNKVNSEKSKAFTIIIIFLLGIFSKKIIYQNNFTYCIFRSFIGVGMIYMGTCFYRILNGINNLLIILILLSINIITTQLNGLIDICSLTFNNKLLFIISAVTGSFSIIMIFKSCNINISYLGKKFINYYGNTSSIHAAKL